MEVYNVRNRKIDVWFMPKGTVCDKMCDTCPFQPDGTGHAVDHSDFPQILRNIEAGLSFFCHRTVIFDDRTTFNGKGNDRVPEPHYQPHFEGCHGAVQYKRGFIEPPVPAKLGRRQRRD